MKKIAFIFMKMPHGTSSGREGLDLVLSTSALTANISVFFISDGVCQLLTEQNPSKILARNYIPTYKLLPFYDINNLYVCQDDLELRGFANNSSFIIPAKIVSAAVIQLKLSNHDVILTF